MEHHEFRDVDVVVRFPTFCIDEEDGFGGIRLEEVWGSVAVIVVGLWMFSGILTTQSLKVLLLLCPSLSVAAAAQVSTQPLLKKAKLNDILADGESLPWILTLKCAVWRGRIGRAIGCVLESNGALMSIDDVLSSKIYIRQGEFIEVTRGEESIFDEGAQSMAMGIARLIFGRAESGRVKVTIAIGAPACRPPG